MLQIQPKVNRGIIIIIIIIIIILLIIIIIIIKGIQKEGGSSELNKGTD